MVLFLLCTSRGQHQHSNAAKTSRNGARTPEIRSRPQARAKSAALTEAAGRVAVAHGGVFVLDCDGMGRRHLGEIRIFKYCSVALKILHPERQRKTFIVRAPRVFSLVWKLLKPMLDARIISKINILGVHDDLQPLVDELGAENLPSIFGGQYDLRCPPSNELIPAGAFAKFKEEQVPAAEARRSKTA